MQDWDWFGETERPWASWVIKMSKWRFSGPHGLASMLEFWSGYSRVRTMTFRVIHRDLLDHRFIADPQCVECPNDYFPASNGQGTKNSVKCNDIVAGWRRRGTHAHDLSLATCLLEFCLSAQMQCNLRRIVGGDAIRFLIPLIPPLFGIKLWVMAASHSEADLQR